MLALGLMLIFFGLPLVPLGLYFRKEASKQAEKVAREKEKTRGKKDKKSKRSSKKKDKERDKDQPGKERGTSGGGSLIIGGSLTTLAGIACVVKHFMG